MLPSICTTAQGRLDRCKFGGRRYYATADLADSNLNDAYLLNIKYQGAILDGVAAERVICSDDFASVLNTNPKRRSASTVVAFSELQSNTLERLYPLVKSIARRFTIALDADTDDIAQNVMLAILGHNIGSKFWQLSEQEAKTFYF